MTDVRDMSERLRMFCGWKELRDEAEKWKASQEVKKEAFNFFFFCNFNFFCASVQVWVC